MPNSNPFEIVIDQIRDLRKEAEEQFADKPQIKTRVTAELTKLERYLCNLGRIKPEAPERRVFGPIEIQEKPAPILPDKSPKQLEADQLRALISEVETNFLERENAEIVDSVDDLVVRGVAIRAGLEGITETDPEKITIEFVEDIKKAMLLNKQLEAVDAKVSEEDKKAIQEFKDEQLDEAFELLDDLSKENLPIEEPVKEEQPASTVEEPVKEEQPAPAVEEPVKEEQPVQTVEAPVKEEPKGKGKKKNNDPA